MRISSNKLVSVIIPAYNVEKYISECLHSILNQTYTNIEVIIIDDGSKDQTYNIAKQIIKKDKRIKLYSQENQGVNKARKKGLDVAKGEYIMFVDSDDWLDSDTIEKLMNFINKYPKVDVIKFSMLKEPTKQIKNIINKNSLLIEKENYQILYSMLIKTYNLNSICATFIKKEIFNNNFKSLNISYSFAEDFMINIDLLNNSKEMLLLNNPFYHYRTNMESTTKKRNKDIILKNTQNAFTAYSELKNYIEIWKLNPQDVEFKIFKEVCEESAKLVLCDSINSKTMEQLIKKTFNNMDLFDNLKNLNYRFLKKKLNQMALKEKIQYYLYIKFIYKKKYALAIKSLIFFKIKNK